MQCESLARSARRSPKCLTEARLFGRKIFSANGVVTPISASNSFHSPNKDSQNPKVFQNQAVDVFR
jgi:hypothetical protein